ncbi:hypothetical protein Hanom_Chr00s000006g01614251 [Helianthus anomalus]
MKVKRYSRFTCFQSVFKLRNNIRVFFTLSVNQPKIEEKVGARTSPTRRRPPKDETDFHKGFLCSNPWTEVDRCGVHPRSAQNRITKVKSFFCRSLFVLSGKAKLKMKS